MLVNLTEREQPGVAEELNGRWLDDGWVSVL
jgi:hypothetical protein